MNTQVKLPYMLALNRLAEKKWFPYLLLGVITLIGAMLRLYKLGDWSFWIEEIHTLRHAQSLQELNLASILSRDHFYQIIKLILTFFGVSEWTARIFPVILGIITIPLIFWLVKVSFNVELAFIVAFIIAISPWHIYWSQNARFYVYLLILYSSSLFAFYWGMETNKIFYYGISILALGLAIATNQFAIILIGIYIMYYLIIKFLKYEKPAGLQNKTIVFFIVVPFLVYLFYEAYRYYSGSTFLILQIYYLFFNKETISFIGLKTPYITLTAVLYYIGVPLALLSILGSYRLFQFKSRIGLLIVLGAYIPLFILMILTSFASTSNRYVFMTLPCWIVLSAVGVKELLAFGRKKAVALVIFMLVLMIFSLKDPLIEDLIYYSVGNSIIGILIGILIIGIISIILLLEFHRKPQKSVVSDVMGLIAFLPLFLHPIVADNFYFKFQHGHRDNWKAVAEVVRANRLIGEPIVSYLPPLAEYYMGAPILNINDIDLDEIIHQYEKIWFVEDETYELLEDNYFEEWAVKNCNLNGNWNQYTAGRLWKMRLYMCSENLE